MFDFVRVEVGGRHFADHKELKRSFPNVLLSQRKEFYNICTQRLAQRWQDLKMMQSSSKNNLTIAKVV
jgi:hypothetical protein